MKKETSSSHNKPLFYLAFLVVATVLFAGCGADDGLGPEVGLEEYSEPLSIGDTGGGFDGPAQTYQETMCILQCLIQLRNCERNNGSDPDGVLAPCDWLYRLCISDCR